jgi:hypothetical protein
MSKQGEKIAAMTISRDTGPGFDVDPYDVPRGTCPSCGSGRVRHHIIGYPPPPEARNTPRWVSWEGCLHPGYTRSCRACGARWLEDLDEDPGG